jgi:hypothetical protein
MADQVYAQQTIPLPGMRLTAARSWRMNGSGSSTRKAIT